ncbi:DUF6364 family protein [uncultured Pseudacidovorax sp.]|uniref:DUF6364 family protein n=1 Tax=uncultured Pseudacidovorax sp. TaxID=679313 RepID=UPI0025DD49BB|nr:DUF6364 family protein [uncultured Pseudacidovorax sp.]
MANLTINVDDQLIKAARVRAIQQGTSLSAKVREFLQQYVNEAEASRQMLRDAATARLMAAIDAAASEAQPAAQPRSGGLRDELYDGDFRARARSAD